MKTGDLIIPDFSKMPTHRSFEKTQAKKKKFHESRSPPLKMRVYILEEEDVLLMLLKDRRIKEAAKITERD